MPIAADTVLGPYKIIAAIGEGGMGEVYRARDTRIGRDVAVKVLSSITAKDGDMIARFEQEARASGMLNHPNLLTIFDVGTFNGAPYIISELLEGETLRDRLNASALPPRRAVDYALQMAQGLTAAHEKGIVHRDLKPENIFITKEGRVKIFDFGIAKLNPHTTAETPAFKMAATEAGMVLGTVGYMSPEQVRGEPVDQRSDIFSFGTILYEMISGSRAFKRDTSIETLTAILREEPDDLAMTNPSVPPALDRVIRRCLEKNRDVRFQTARDLAFHLETISINPTHTPAAPPRIPIGETSALPAQSIGMTGNRSTSSPATQGTSARPAVARPATAAVPIRTKASQQPVKKRTISPALLWLFFVVALAGAGWGGYTLARRQFGSEKIPEFQRITFRRGEVRTARFTPEGNGVVYSAAWEGRPTEVFLTYRQSPESRSIGLVDAEISAISRTSEIAVVLRRDRMSGLGTLARIPLAGGTPREVSENVLQADWSRDGKDLAVIRVVNGKHRIEYPIGRVRYETAHFIRDLRISPNGAEIAFIEPQAGANDISLVGATGPPVTLARGWNRGARGLAWSADGKEIWFTGTDTGAPPALHAVNRDGDIRLIQRVTGALVLQDISRNGDVLMAHNSWRATINFQPPGETAERDVSWLDWTMLNDLSADGQKILMSETREGGGASGGVFLRRNDNNAPIRLGDGFGDALSPDGRWVLAHQGGSKLVLLPTASGEAREIKVTGAFDQGAAWFPDGRRVVLAGVLPNEGYRLHILDTDTGETTPLSPEGNWGDALRPFVISPDGRWVAGMDSNKRVTLYPVTGEAPVEVPAAEPGEIPIQWSADNSLLVYRSTSVPARVYKIALSTGTRELWREFFPSDPAGVYKLAPIFTTRDGSGYAYNSLRTLSDLYIVQNVK